MESLKKKTTKIDNRLRKLFSGQNFYFSNLESKKFFFSSKHE